jgi:hypothetical protein
VRNAGRYPLHARTRPLRTGFSVRIVKSGPDPRHMPVRGSRGLPQRSAQVLPANGREASAQLPMIGTSTRLPF